MTPSPTRLERACYLALAGIALVATQTTLVCHFVSGGSVASFFTDAVASPAAVFAVVDLFVVAAVALVFLVAEARRLGIRHWWIFVLLTFTVAISVAFPLFLAVRARRLGWAA